MTRNLLIAVLAALAVDTAAIGYGSVAAAQEDASTCRHEHGVVRHHDCIRDGHVLFGVPL